MKTILLLEDDDILSETLVELFESENFDVTVSDDGEKVLDITFENRFDIYIFDVNVKNLDGFELLKMLRDAGDDTPTIFLTALSDISSLAKGFDVGADDYIKKPFDFDELLVRINAILKKRYNLDSQKIKVKNLYFDMKKDELYKDSEFIQLSPYELKIVKLFFKNLDKTLLKDYILQELSDDKDMRDGSLRVYINKLRKIGLNIVTIKGVGYRFSSS